MYAVLQTQNYICYFCYCPNNFPTVSELFSDADDQLFLRISHIQTHVLKPLLPADTQHSYNLRDRSHNYSLITKDSHRPSFHRATVVQTRLLTFYRILLLTIYIVKLRSVNFILNEYWIGLDWIGLDWIGLDWIGLDWIGLDRLRHGEVGTVNCQTDMYCCDILYHSTPVGTRMMFSLSLNHCNQMVVQTCYSSATHNRFRVMVVSETKVFPDNLTTNSKRARENTQSNPTTNKLGPS